jgi:flagellar hook-basal body complex protein FliE
MDVRFNTPLLTALQASKNGAAPLGAGLGKVGGGLSSTSGQPEVGGLKFAQAMNKALQGVSDAQNTASAMQRELQLGNPTVTLEETMLAMQKSQIAFQAAVTVRNRLVSAYTDIMNMSV